MQPASEFSRFVRGLVGFSIGPVLSAVLGFLLIPVTTFLISPEELGRGSFFITVNQLILLVAVAGFDQAFVREYHSEHEKSLLFTNTILPPSLVVLLIIAFSLLFWKTVSMLIVGQQSIGVVIILCFSIAASISLRFTSLLIRMQEKSLLYSLFNILTKVLNLSGLIIFALAIRSDYMAVIFGYSISIIAIAFVQRFLMRKQRFFSIRLLSGEKILGYLRYGTPLAVAGGFMWILNSMDKIALRSWSTFGELGLYSNAFRIAGLFTIIQAAFSTFFAPTSYRWYSEGKTKDRFSYLSSALGYLMSILFSVILLFRDLIRLIIDVSYHDSILMIPFLLLYPIMYTLSETTAVAISFTRKTWMTLIAIITAAIINFVGNYLLVPLYGGMGASVSTGVSFIVFFWLRTTLALTQMRLINIAPHVVTTVVMLTLAGLTAIGGFDSIIISLCVLSIVVFSVLLVISIRKFRIILGTE